ncbi:MAG: 4Fe-4S cluster-binding domain-containing protein [Treponema sp.]|jgi:hypothetical protein|nr:4Fe-4S cluster-binding domain-containing protein [Treponema sp.]
MEKRAFNILEFVRNTIVKIIPENSQFFRWMTLIGLKINARKHHKPLKSLVMGVYATQHCNLNCKCCTAFSPIAEEEFLNIETYKKDMEKLAKLTENKLTSFYVSGGEPLLHPQILEIFNVARELFPKTMVNFMTNGLLLLKMPEISWENCQKNNVTISVSRYPINIDINGIKEKSNKYNVKFEYIGGDDVPVKSMWKYPLDLEGKQSLKTSYNICSQINRCITMKDGLIYACNTIAGIEHFNKYFNTNLEVLSGDVLKLHEVKKLDEIYEYLSTPKPFCRYCNRKGLILGIKYGTSKKEINEWT